MVEPVIRARLVGDNTLNTLVNGRVYQSQPAINPTPPSLVFTATSAETNTYLSGPSRLTRYGLQVDAAAVDADELNAILARISLLLHGWQGGGVKFCKRTGHSTAQNENGYTGTQTYDIWYTGATVTTLPDSTGTIQTGPDSVTLQACDNVLSLTCDGLKLNGEDVGGCDCPEPEPLPETIAYTDEANTFTAGPNTFQTGAADAKGLVVKGASSQSANLQEWQNSSGTPNALIDSNGRLLVGPPGNTVGLGNFGSGFTEFYADQPLYFRSQQMAGTFYFITTGWRDSDGQDYTVIKWRASSEQEQVLIKYNPNNQAGAVQLRIQAGSSQTNNLTEWQNSGGTVQFAIGAEGKVKTNQTSSGSTLGTVTGKMPVYDAAGTLVGYLPIYDSIT